MPNYVPKGISATDSKFDIVIFLQEHQTDRGDTVLILSSKREEEAISSGRKK